MYSEDMSQPSQSLEYNVQNSAVVASLLVLDSNFIIESPDHDCLLTGEN